MIDAAESDGFLVTKLRALALFLVRLMKTLSDQITLRFNIGTMPISPTCCAEGQSPASKCANSAGYSV
jgi:hypothetical protein